MPSFRKYLCHAVLVLVLVSLPFFEGGESPFGLFLVHSLTLLLAGLVVWSDSSIWVPKFFSYFALLLLSFLISTLIAPYRFSAALELWDFLVVIIFSVAVFSVFQENQTRLIPFLKVAFFSLAAGLLGSLLLPHVFHGTRLAGAFVNANDFASFALLLVLFGAALFEQENSSSEKKILLLVIAVLSVCMFAALSRSVFLACAVILGAYLWKTKPSRGMTLSLMVVLILGLAFLSRRFFSHDPYEYYRLRIWSNSLKAVLLNPYLGIGLNMLPQYAAQFNFPANVEVGRYARLATSADNQYFQILIETGFVGLFLFLIAWIALYFALPKQDKRFLPIRLAFVAISIIGFFGLPIFCTAILFLLFFLILFPISQDPNQSIRIPLKVGTKVGLTSLLLLLFVYAVLRPYWADREFQAAIQSKDAGSAQAHLSRAILLNPYQPYYSFHFLKQMIDAQPEQTSTESWLRALRAIDHSIHQNPLEPDFYVSRAKVLRILYEKTHQVVYISEAMAAYQAALSNAPTSVFLKGEFADFERRQGHYGLAIRQLEEMIRLEPAFLNAYFVLAELRFRSEDRAGAQAAFSKGEELQKHYQNYPVGPKDRYNQRLLSVSSDYKEKVRGLIFGNDQK